MKLFYSFLASLLFYFVQPAYAVTSTGFPITHGSFTVTFATGCTTTPTQTWKYAKVGNGPGSLVTIYAGTSAISCTSNSTSFTISGLPAFLQPSVITLAFSSNACEDNGAFANCLFTLNASSTITLNLCTAAACSAGFTATGVKGIPGAGIFHYTL